MPENYKTRGSKLHKALDDACTQGDVAMVAKCLDEGADINNGFSHGSTPLHIAAEWGNKDVCALLLDRGADIEATDDWDDTPLYRASLTGSVNDDMDTAIFLVGKGASLISENNRGVSPLEVARTEGGEKFAQILLDARQAYEAEQSKKALLEGLDTVFVACDTRDQEQPRQTSRRM